MKELIFLADESVDFRLVRFIRTLNYSVESFLEDAAGSSDEVVLEKANQAGAILFTEDKDFGELIFRLHKLGPGVILLRLGGLSLDLKIELIKQVFSNFGVDLYGKFTVVTKDQLRMKLL